ncbi:MAG: hypothetical protein ACR2IE_16355 [Candidatus Sumerlaeaceae bacterium]
MISKQGVLTILAIFACLLGLALTAIRPAGRWYFRRNLSPADIVRLDEFETKPIHFPPEWQNVTPVPPKVEAAIIKYANAYKLTDWLRSPINVDQPLEYNAYIRLVRGCPVPPETWTSVSMAAAYTFPVITAAVEAARLPEWDQEYCMATRLDAYSTVIVGRALNVTAAEFLHLNDTERAMELALAGVALTSRGAPCPAYMGYWDAWVQRDTLNVLSTIARTTTSTDLLEIALKALNGLEPRIIHAAAQYAPAGYSIARLRLMKRYHWNVDFPPGLPAYEYVRRDSLAAFAFVRAMNMLPVTDPRKESMSWFSDYMGSGCGASPMSERRVKLSYMLFPDEIAIQSQPHSDRFALAESLAKANLDLARIALVARIRELSGVPVVINCTAFQSGPLPGATIDPFSGKPYLWDEARQQFYSIGPDHHDDHAVTGCQFFDGSISGDVMIPSPLPPDRPLPAAGTMIL